jgi:hypothetical protein
MRTQIKLYSLTAPLLVLPLLDITVSGVWDYVRGMEFRTFMAEIITQVFSGVADAVIISAVSGSPEGTPSTTVTSIWPWDSPAVRNRNWPMF